MKLASALFGATALVAATTAASAAELTIATVNNSDMIIMQELSSQFEEASGHTLNWVVLEENVLRQRVTTDIATGGGSFDVITIGAYEAPIWGAQDWLEPLDDLGDAYNYEDIFERSATGFRQRQALRVPLCGKLRLPYRTTVRDGRRRAPASRSPTTSCPRSWPRCMIPDNGSRNLSAAWADGARTWPLVGPL